MSLNPVIDMSGRRLRLAVIGGGTGLKRILVWSSASRLEHHPELVSRKPAQQRKNARHIRNHSDLPRWSGDGHVGRHHLGRTGWVIYSTYRTGAGKPLVGHTWARQFANEFLYFA